MGATARMALTDRPDGMVRTAPKATGASAARLESVATKANKGRAGFRVGLGLTERPESAGQEVSAAPKGSAERLAPCLGIGGTGQSFNSSALTGIGASLWT